MCSCDVGLDWCAWLWMAKFRKHLAHWDGCFGVDKKGTQFCLRRGWHDCSNLFARYWGRHHCWRICCPFWPWTCVLPRNCKMLTWINMMHHCELLRTCYLCSRLVLRSSPALQCSPRIVYIAPLFSLLGSPFGRQVSLALGAVLRQLFVQGTEILRIPLW